MLTDADVAARARALLAPPSLSAPTLVDVTPDNAALKLDPRRDYLVRLPRDITLPRGLSISGGRNVIVGPGHIHIDGPRTDIRGLYLKGQTGVMYAHGIRLTGEYHGDGINLDQREPGATVVLRDITIDKVVGTQGGNHADLVQTWAGPSRLVVSNLTGTSTYQGMFLLPRQHFADGPWPEFFYLEDVAISCDGYALWVDPGQPFPIVTRRVTVNPRPAGRDGRDWWLWPKPSTGNTTFDAVTIRPGT